MSQTNAHHVYALIDPRNRTIFYIGKGKGKRSEAHVIESNKSNHESNKLKQIRDIHSDGYKVEVIYLAKGYKSSEEAIAIETLLIQTAKNSKEVLGIKCNLTNIQPGEHPENVRAFGLCQVDEIFDLEDPEAILKSSRKLFDSIKTSIPSFNVGSEIKPKRVQTQRQSNDFVIRVYIPNDTTIYFEYLYFRPHITTHHQRHLAKEIYKQLIAKESDIKYSLNESHANVSRKSVASQIGQHEIIIDDLNCFISEIKEFI